MRLNIEKITIKDVDCKKFSPKSKAKEIAKAIAVKRSEVRRNLWKDKKVYAYGFLQELLSHQSGFPAAKKYLMKLVGLTSNDTYSNIIKDLIDSRHLIIEGKHKNTIYWIFERPRTEIEKNQLNIEIEEREIFRLKEKSVALPEELPF